MGNFNPYNNQFKGYSFQPYNKQQYAQNGGFVNQHQKPFVKHSGCTSGIDKRGKNYVRGWKYTKGQGLVTFFAAPYHGTKSHKSNTGNVWHNWVVKIEHQRTMQTTVLPCLVNSSFNKVIIKKLGFVMNTKGGKGGYVGPFYVRK